MVITDETAERARKGSFSRNKRSGGVVEWWMNGLMD
jgi:hypothetical protein